jgi:hypothetical protein
MARPSKLTPDIQKRIGDNIALGLTYRLAAEAARITYKTFNIYINRGKTEKSGKYYQFAQYIKKRNAEGALKLVERLNEAVDAGNCQVCMWILDRRFPAEFGRRVYQKTNFTSVNRNETVEIIVKDFDITRKEIMDKFSLVGEKKNLQLLQFSNPNSILNY